MTFDLSNDYCNNHSIESLDLELMCVRVKDPENGSEKDAGYWVGHFQVSEELRRKRDVKGIQEEALEKKSTTENEDILVDGDEPISTASAPPTSIQSAKKMDEKAKSRTESKKGEKYRPGLARLIYSSIPIPDVLITKQFCYVTVELISLGIPDRLVKIKISRVQKKRSIVALI